MIQRLLLLAAWAALPPGILARGEDWPEFRGPTGQGLVREGGLPLVWGPSRNVTWKQPIPGSGWSSPAVAGGRVYLTTGVAAEDSRTGDLSLRALCLDARTGQPVWDREVFHTGGAGPRIHPKNSHASPTPVVHAGRLYVHFGHQGTACLDLAGNVLWRNTRLRYAPRHGNGGSPTLAGNALVFSCDGEDQQFVAALDCATGQLLWKTDRGVEALKGFSFSTPLVIELRGRQLVVSPGSDVVGAYDARTGREVWRVRYDGYSVVPRPVHGHGLVFLSTGYNSPTLLAIRPDGRGDVTQTHVAWSTRRGAPATPSPLLVGDELYLVADDGVASCLDARTGRVWWRRRLGGSYSASPLWAQGRVYFQSEEGVGVVVRAGKQFQLLARNDLRERTLASCAAADGALFIRTEHHLYRIQQR